MRAKKILSFVLAALVVMSAAGCGNKTSDVGNVKVSEANVFPIVEEPTELTIFVPKSAFIEDFKTNEFTKYYEDLTNVKINWEVASGDATQALNLKLASGNYPDIFFGFSFSKEQQNLYGNEGLFTDISGYIDDYGYYLKDVFKVRPDIREDITINNAIYGLPKVAESPFNVYSNALWIYKPWLDKLGLDVPTTTDELYDVLKKFKNSDPNGNGKADEIPLAARGVSSDFGLENFLMSSFCPVGYDRLYVDNGKIRFVANTEEYREGLRYIKKLYDEGLIYQDSFITDRDGITALGESTTPILGAGTGMWAGMFTINGSASGRIGEYVSVPPLKGPKGFRSSRESTSDISTVQFVVTSACKNPQVAIKWIDWFFNEENRIQSYAMPGFRKAKEGEIGIDGQQAIWAQDPITESGTAFGSIQNKGWTNFGVFYKPMEEDFRTAQNDEKTRIVTQNRYEEYMQHKEVGKDFNVPMMTYSKEDAQRRAEYITTITSLVDNAFAEFVTGVRSLDSDWNAYVKSLDDVGLQDFIAMLQKNYDEQVK